MHHMQCNRRRSLDIFLKGVLSESITELAVVGCGCSSATEPVAEIIQQWNISLVRQAESIVLIMIRVHTDRYYM